MTMHTKTHKACTHTHQHEIMECLCRVIVFSGQMQADFLLEWFGNLDVNWATELLKEMMSKDLRANLQICVQVHIHA